MGDIFRHAFDRRKQKIGVEAKSQDDKCGRNVMGDAGAIPAYGYFTGNTVWKRM